MLAGGINMAQNSLLSTLHRWWTVDAIVIASNHNGEMEFKELISSFAEKYGIENVSLENGEVTLVVDYTAVTIREAENARAILVSAMIGGPVPDAKGRLVSYMLQANHLLAGANAMTICQKQDTDEYLVVQAIPRALADVDLLAKAVDNIVKTVSNWQGIVASGDVGQSADSRLV